ncbi:MAG: MFS transporter [Cyanobacteria bacterium P01_C01_bin.72]
MSLNTDSIDSNIWKLYVLRGLAFAWFPIPTIILFYQSHGLDLEQAVLLKTILSLSILLGEVPSGYIADLLGRKFCLVAGSGVWIIGWLFYCGGNSFTIFALAEILTGIAGSLISGADTAIAYETLLQLGRASYYRTLEGRLVAIAGVTEAVCGIIGAAIAEINLVIPFYLQTVCLIIYFCLALTLTEPQRHQSVTEKPKIESLKSIVIDVLVLRPKLRWLIGLSSTFSTASFLIVWLSQDYLRQVDVSIAAMGWAWAVFHLLMSLASVNARRIETVWGMRKMMLVLVLSLAIAYILLGSISTIWGMAFIATIYIVRGLCSPLILNLINQQIPSSVRATVLSINSFTFRLSFAVVAPVLGAIASGYSLSLALFVGGWYFLIAGSLCWWLLVKLKVIE